MEYIVKIDKLSKKIKNHMLLDNINLEIKKNGVYGIVGRNGSGKSLLFKIISGLINPTSGEVEVLGYSINKGEFPKEFGALLDSGGFLLHYSAFKNLKLLASIKNQISDDEIRDCLEFVGLNPDNSSPVKTYSLGMKQRLGIAQAIMEKPKLLILDEPMNGLDASGVKDIQKMIIEFKNKGVTILLASHNQSDIDLLCDEVYEMNNGKISKL